jgi:hypothetical protein
LRSKLACGGVHSGGRQKAEDRFPACANPLTCGTHLAHLGLNPVWTNLFAHDRPHEQKLPQTNAVHNVFVQSPGAPDFEYRQKSVRRIGSLDWTDAQGVG